MSSIYFSEKQKEAIIQLCSEWFGKLDGASDEFESDNEEFTATVNEIQDKVTQSLRQTVQKKTTNSIIAQALKIARSEPAGRWRER